MKKRIISILLTLTLVLVLAPSVFAAEPAVIYESEGQGWTIQVTLTNILKHIYNEDTDSTCIIVEEGTVLATSRGLPDLVEAIPVTNITFGDDSVSFDYAGNWQEVTQWGEEAIKLELKANMLYMIPASPSYIQICVVDSATAATLKGVVKLIATPTASKVLVNGKDTAFDAYNISGNNYFKLRDLAFVLSGTEKQFEVSWDSANNAISLTSGKSYTPVGGEMAASTSTGSKTPTATSSKIYLNGEEIALTAYNINGNNYFKLRDIMKIFDVYVGWDSATSTITLDTSKGYTD